MMKVSINHWSHQHCSSWSHKERELLVKALHYDNVDEYDAIKDGLQIQILLFEFFKIDNSQTPCNVVCIPP